MKTFLTALLRALARVAQSEAGELLSVRRKAHLLEAERYVRLAAAAEPQRPAAAQRATALSARCARLLPTRHAH
jgi:hypothetical protein